MDSFWSNLNSREKTLILLSCGLGLLLAVFLFWIEPNYRRLNTLRQQVPRTELDLDAMKGRLQRAQPLLATLKQSKPRSTASLLTRIEKSATESGLRKAINRIQPRKDNQVRVWLNEVYFDPWLKWIEVLKSEKIEVIATSITRTDNNKVNIRVTLE